MDTIIQQIYRAKAYTRPMVTGVILVAVYARISFDRHGKRYGVSDQVKDVIALIENTPGLAVGEAYEDNDVSAFDKEVERPNYNRLVADIRAGEYTAVACVRGSRLVRQRRQRAEFIDLMESVAGKVYTTDGTVYDFTSEVGRGQFDSDGAKDTSESEKIAARTARAHLRAPTLNTTRGNELVRRLVAGGCEMCGAVDSVEVHHVRHLADLTKPGRREKPAWARLMATRKRKTLVVCRPCHEAIPAGRPTTPSSA